MDIPPQGELKNWKLPLYSYDKTATILYSKTCFFYDGCEYHGHFCRGRRVISEAERRRCDLHKAKQQRARDYAIRRSLMEAGYRVVVMHECVWLEMLKRARNPRPHEYIDQRMQELAEREHAYLSADVYDDIPLGPVKRLRLRQFVNAYFRLPQHGKFRDHHSLVDEIRRGRFFGVVVADLRLPDDPTQKAQLMDYFAEQTPSKFTNTL